MTIEMAVVAGGFPGREVSREEFVAYMVDKERTLRDVFTRIDLAGTGWLSREEFSQAMRNFKLSVQPGARAYHWTMGRHD